MEAALVAGVCCLHIRYRSRFYDWLLGAVLSSGLVNPGKAGMAA